MSLTLTRRHNVDRFGYLIPTKYGNVPMLGAVATYRPGEGRFGGAVAVEESTVNLIDNPTSWVASTNQYQTTVETDERFLGCVVSETTKISSTTPVSPLGSTLTIQPGETYTASIYVKIIRRGEAPGYLPVIKFWKSDYSVGLASGTAANIIGEWQRVIVTYTNNTDEPILVRVVYYPTSEVGAITRQAAPQVEQKPFATSFVDGTRARGVLHYDGGPISLGANEGTFSMWMYVDVSIPRGGGYPTYPQQCRLEFESGSLWCRSYSPTQFDLLASTDDGAWTAIGGSITNTGWHLWTATWSDGKASLYIDGSKVGSRVLGDYAPSGRLSKLYVGCGHTNPAVPGSLFDELLILPYAASEEEIVSWYEAQGPLLPHPQASLQWDRQTVRPAQMVKL